MTRAAARRRRCRSRAASLSRDAVDERRQAGAVLVSCVAGVGERVADRVERRRRRPVVHHALAERNRARRLADQSPTTGMIGAWTASIRVRARQACLACCLDGKAGLSLLDDSSPNRARRSPSCWPARSLAPRSFARWSLDGRRGTLQTPEQFIGFKVGADNKLVALGQDRRLHEARRGRTRTACRFRELGKTSSDNPFIVARNQRRPTR